MLTACNLLAELQKAWISPLRLENPPWINSVCKMGVHKSRTSILMAQTAGVRSTLSSTEKKKLWIFIY